MVAGSPTLRTPEGERKLTEGDLVCFPDGPSGAHQVINRSDRPARLLILSTLNLPGITRYPDSAKIGVRLAGDAMSFRVDSAVDYWEGEG